MLSVILHHQAIYLHTHTHTQSKHERISYDCDLCHKTFTNMSTLIEHKKSKQEGIIWKNEVMTTMKLKIIMMFQSINQYISTM